MINANRKKTNDREKTFMKTKRMIIALTLLLALCLSACGGRGAKNDEQGTDTSAALLNADVAVESISGKILVK